MSHSVLETYPRSGHWHQLDLVITRRDALNNVLNTRSYHSADCDTGHSLICAIIRMQPKRLFHSKQKGHTHINISDTTYPENNQQFIESIRTALSGFETESAEENWNPLRDIIYDTALITYGKKQRKNSDWYEENITLMEPVIDAKRSALINFKRDPSGRNKTALRAARNKAQQTARHCANNYWLQLCQSIQTSSDTGNIRGMYDGIKKATGPTIKKTAPLKQNQERSSPTPIIKMERWVEHYLELYSTENTITDEALDTIESLPVMTELDTEPTEDDLSKAIDSLKNGKATGKYDIPPEVIKHGKPALLHHLHILLLICWKEGTVHQEMRYANIVTLYKNKGDRSDCNDYRGISLLSVVGKVFARVTLTKLQILPERTLPESQCGFRTGRSTIDMIFSVRQLQEKCREQRRPLFIAFIDLTKASDLVSRQGLFNLLEKIGCPPKLLSVISSFHNNMKGTVNYDGATSEPFEIHSGVKQGCVLAPTLFSIFFSMMLSHAFKTSTEGVFLHTRADGKLFNLARLRANTKVRHVVIREMLFGDDAALVTHTMEDLQQLIDRLSHA